MKIIANEFNKNFIFDFINKTEKIKHRKKVNMNI